MKKIPVLEHVISRKTSHNISKIFLLFLLSAFFCLSPLYGQRSPIDINLIIDSSSSLAGVKGEINAWLTERLDEILVDGDRVIIWSAGLSSSVIYSGSINTIEKETVKAKINDIIPQGSSADFTGALRDAAARQVTGYSYTLLITASPDALSSILSGPNINLLRFSRIEEHSLWRSLVVGLNIDSRVKRDAAAFLYN